MVEIHTENLTNIPNKMELCLCPSCASSFYNMKDRIIRRVDPMQTEKEACTMCSYRTGYDYYIFLAPKPRKKRKHDVQTWYYTKTTG